VFGRDEHLQHIRQQLRRQPVVGLLGPRQIGKTTVAREFAQRVLEEGATVLFGRSSAAASSVTVAARSWSRPRIVVRRGWLIAFTWEGLVSAIRSARS